MRLGLARLLLVVLLLSPAALAQEITPVLVERVGEEELAADVGQPATAEFRLFNLNRADESFVTVSVSSARGWTSEVDQNEFFLGARNETVVRVTFTPEDTPRGSAVFEVRFAFVGAAGEVTRQAETVEVLSAAPPRVVGLFPNPLGPPLDNAYGTFLLDMAVWVVVGVVSVVASHTLVRLAMNRAHTSTTHAVSGKLRRPLFIFILLLGLARSFAILPRNPVTTFISKFLLAIAVTVFGLYVLYRMLEAVLVYYQREIAPKTATKVDDVLVPAFRKVGLVIIYIVGIILTLRNLGWDPTLVFAGAGIAGLVIAFAAQDTFSNLFSGVFLMLDRPFVEGDDIMLETGETARVVNIGLRTTRLHNYQTYEDIIVPNNQLATRRIVNHTSPDPRYRVNIDVGVAYGTDPELVRRVLLEVAHAHPLVEKREPLHPSVRFMRFGDSSLDFVLRCVIPSYQQRNEIASQIRFEIVKAFQREDIQIPFPQRVVHVRNEPS
ncbi:MAG TPA: mechanosensitive ion channel domain-containing protein [Candidatus Thermoplasmatota archaeon]|nr:mechanosensitive ion channel domain-containing protein [Candidatus Thermoplasmatota archaeon]